MVTFDQIISAVCAIRGVTKDDIMSTSRKQRVSIPRHMAMSLCRQFIPEYSYPDLGYLFGRDHSTALMGVRRASEWEAITPGIKQQMEGLRAFLSGEAPAETFSPLSPLSREQSVKNSWSSNIPWSERPVGVR